MASMQRQPSQRRQPTQSTPPAVSPVRSQSPVDDRSAFTSDSTGISSDPKQEEEHEQTQTQEQVAEHDEETQVTAPVPSADDDPSVKKCWICFSDSTEDTPETSPWRDPCPCALVAHEACLLDWIADVEAPKNSGRGGALSGGQILCPQCKSQIKLARPRSVIVDGVRLLDTVAGRLVMPGGAIVLSVDLLYKLSFAHGMHSIYRIFGSTDAERILRPVMQHWVRPPIDFDLTMPEIRQQLFSSFTHYLQHWRLYLGLPLITPVVLLSRTTWHFSEAFLIVLPTVFFALQPSTPDEIFDFGVWPPSASMAFALLPYVRQAYNFYYEKVWGERERRWKRELLPPTSQEQTGNNAPADPAARIEEAVDDTHVFEIRVDGGIWEENVEEEADAAPAPDVPDNRGQQVQEQAVEAANPARRDVAAERRLSFSPAAVAENVLGALAFPTIAELSGEVLRLVLPNTWTSPATITTFGTRTGLRSVSRGFLQEKWGRSLVGGCLFVIFKDALMLYVRWKMAQMHRNRRVLDFDRSKLKPKS